MILNLHENGEYISDFIRKNGCWEPLVSEVLLELLRSKAPNTVFVDIGANIGYFTLFAAAEGVPVVAFEPIAANYRLLSKSVEENNCQNLVRTFMIPLSDTKERLTINVANYNMGMC